MGSGCGTLGGYKSGCRCLLCRRANAAYVKAWRERPAQVKKQEKLERRSKEARIISERMRALDAAVARIAKEIIKTPPQDWELDRAIVDERDALRSEVVLLNEQVRDLNDQLDQCIDTMTKPELKRAAAPRGRPRKHV